MPSHTPSAIVVAEHTWPPALVLCDASSHLGEKMLSGMSRLLRGPPQPRSGSDNGLGSIPLSPARTDADPSPEVELFDPSATPAEGDYLSEHIYSVPGKGGDSLVLKFRSCAGSARKPLFYENSIIEGTVRAMSEIDQISITLAGYTRLAGDGSPKQFMSVDCLLDYSQEQSDQTGSSHSPRSIPFSVRFPEALTAKEQAGDVTTGLPPSFSSKSCLAIVEYRLEVQSQRHGEQKPIDRIETPLVYLPRSKPRAGNGPLNGISTGVVTQPWTKVELQLRRPFCYTRASQVPFRVVLESDQTEALERLLRPDYLKVILEEITVVGPAALGWVPTQSTGSSQSIFRRQVTRGKLTATTQPSSGQYRVEGSIALPADLKPSFRFAGLSLHYCISLVIDQMGFKWRPIGKLPEAVVSQDIVIATHPATEVGGRPLTLAQTESGYSVPAATAILDELPTLLWKQPG